MLWHGANLQLQSVVGQEKDWVFLAESPKCLLLCVGP